MKVKDLIEKLGEFDPDAVVIVTSSNFELGGSDVEVSFAHQYDSGKCEVRTFMDAFDYERYDTKVYSIVGGNESVVLIS